MKNLTRFATVAAIAALPLAGCATSGGVTPSSLNTTLPTVENDIVDFAKTLCGFQPELSTVEAIITTLYPAAAIATVPEQAIAQTICSAVPAAPTAPTVGGKLRAATPTLYPGTNIVIHGKYVGRVGMKHRPR